MHRCWAGEQVPATRRARAGESQPGGCEGDRLEQRVDFGFDEIFLRTIGYYLLGKTQCVIYLRCKSFSGQRIIVDYVTSQSMSFLASPRRHF